MLLREQSAGTDNPERMLEKRGVKLTTESSGADTGAKPSWVPSYDIGIRGGS